MIFLPLFPETSILKENIVLFRLIFIRKKHTKSMNAINVKKIHDTVAGGSVLASGAHPPASVVNFFLILKVAHTSLGAVKLLYGCTLFQQLYSCTLSCSVMYIRTLFKPLYTCSCSWAVEV